MFQFQGTSDVVIRSTRFAVQSSITGASLVRTLATLSLCLLVALGFVLQAGAVPVTGGTGPGGIGATDGTSNLKLWLHTGTINQANGTFVTGWSDSSGSGNTATSIGIDPMLMTPVLNGHAVVAFSGNQALAIPTFDLTNMSIFGVTRSSGDRYLLQHTTNRQARLRQGGDPNIAGYNGTSNPISSDLSSSTSDFFLAEWLSTGAANSISFFASGAARGTGPWSGGNPTGFNRVGSWSGFPTSIEIAEIAVFDVRVTSTQRILIENALRSKYGLALLTGAVNVYDGDTLGYHAGVFGVGNDGTGAHTNAGQDGFGIEVSDLSLGANDWVLAGHDGTANTIVALQDAGKFSGSRWSREWYVDVSGDGANVTLGFDFDDAGVGSEFNISHAFSLLYRENDTNPWQILDVTAVAGGGGLVTFAVPSAMLLDGVYTLGINLAVIPEPSSLALLALGGLGLPALRRRRSRN